MLGFEDSAQPTLTRTGRDEAVRRARVRSVAARRTTAGEFGVILNMPRTIDTYAIGAPVGPLRIACAQKIAKFLARAGEVRFAHAAVSGDEPAGQAVCVPLRQIRRQFFVHHCLHAAIRGGRRAGRPIGNGGAAAEACDEESPGCNALEVLQTFSAGLESTRRVSDHDPVDRPWVEFNERRD